MRIPFDEPALPPAGKPPFRCLFDLFFERLLYNDLISSSDDEQLTVGNILAVLAFPGLNLALGLIPKYIFTPPAERHLAVLSDKCLFFSFSMVILGLVTVIEWDSLFPDRRDYAVLNVLPVELRLMFRAKAAALGVLMTVFFVTLNGASLVFFPIAAMEETGGILDGVRFAMAHALAAITASLFIVLFFVALRGLLMALLSYRLFRRVSPWVRLVSLFLLFSALLLLPVVVGIVRPGAAGTMEYARWHPAMWFVGLSEVIEGHASAELRGLAALGAAAFASVAAVTLLTYWNSYRTHVRKSLEGLEPASSAGTSLRALLSKPVDWLLDRRPRELAVFHFTVATTTRSEKHRLFLTAFVGVGLSLVLAKLLSLFAGTGVALKALPDAGWLTIPLALVFFILVGMRVIFVLPADLPSNWIFQITASSAVEGYLGGARKAAALLGIAPLAAGFLPVSVVFWGWTVALQHLFFFAAVSWLLSELLTFRFAKIPFTCAYLPGHANIIFLWTAYALGCMVFVYRLADYERSLLESPAEFARFAALAAIAGSALLMQRRRLLRDGAAPAFQEQSSFAYQRLNLTP